LASASRIYGDQMDSLWGEMVPAAADKVHLLHDGQLIEAAGLQFVALESPGHARHHHVIILGEVGFTGDAAGVHIPGHALLEVPAPPPEFDLEAWQATLVRLRAAGLTTLYPTHFGVVEQVDAHLTMLGQVLVAVTALVQRQMAAGLSRDEIVTAYVNWARERAKNAGMSEAAFQQYATANPHFMSVDGIMRYWRKKSQI